MRFLFVLSNLRGGGAERAVLNLAAGLSARGHDAHVVMLEQAVDYSVPDTVSLHTLTEAGPCRMAGLASARLRARCGDCIND